MRDENRVLRDYLRAELSKIANGVVRDLQRITDIGSGPDSGLKNAWNQICVQRQGEESFLWDAYHQTVRQCISARLEKLPRDLVILIWFAADEMGAEDVNEFDEDALTAYIAGQFVYPLADNYSNKRIERYSCSK